MKVEILGKSKSFTVKKAKMTDPPRFPNISNSYEKEMVDRGMLFLKSSLKGMGEKMKEITRRK